MKPMTAAPISAFLALGVVCQLIGLAEKPKRENGIFFRTIRAHSVAFDCFNDVGRETPIVVLQM